MPKIKVIRLGDEIVNNQLLTEKPSEKIISDFIACIGTVEIRKNHVLLYYAYKLALQRGIDLPQLVIVGSRGWLSSDFQYMVENDSMLKDKIIILDSINDSGLAWIYENCMFTVYPSFYEGWGLPVAESLSYGKFVIASNSSSIPEIAGDLIEYFSPYNSEDCLTQISKYLNGPNLSNKEINSTINP